MKITRHPGFRLHVYLILLAISSAGAHGGSIHIASDDGGPFSDDYQTVAAGPAAHVTITMNWTNGSATVTYHPPNGITQESDTVTGNSEKTTFSIDPTTCEGHDNQITATVNHSGSGSPAQTCIPSGGKPYTFHVLVPKLDVTNITFSGDGQVPVVNQTTTYASTMGANITETWSSSNASPICYKVSSSPVMTVTFSVTPSLGSLKALADFSAVFTQEGPDDEFDYDNKQILITGATATLTGFETGDSGECLDSGIDNGTSDIDFSYSLNSDTSGTTSSCDTSPSMQDLTTLDQPKGGIAATSIRLNYWCSMAEGKTSGADVAAAIGPNAVGMPFPQTAPPWPPAYHNTSNPWGLMDGNPMDCISQASLMQQSLDVLGVGGATLVYIYPVHASWTHLEQTISNGNELSSGGYQLGYGTPPASYQWEGCCKYNGLYWEGGEGDSASSAYNVITDPNNAGPPPTPDQHYVNDYNTFISYPSGTP
jgi:hypothetical protein